jgi:hypothetical protein
MSTISLVFGVDHVYTYDGTGAEDGLKKTFLPKLVLDQATDYGTVYTQAETFVNEVLDGATKIIVRVGDGFGSTTEDGHTLIEPVAPGDFKGLLFVSNHTLEQFIKLHIQKKINATKGILMDSKGYVKYYCYKCNTLNKIILPLTGSQEVSDASTCGHRLETAASHAYTIWHTFVEP